MPPLPILRLDRVSKRYDDAGRPLTVLHEVTLEIATGEFVAVVGVSGSGKSTLLGLMAGLDTPSSGKVELAGTDLSGLDEEQLAAVRNQNVGFVFQSFQLVDAFTALENVALPLELRGDRNARAKATKALNEIGLGARLHHTPRQLSGGEQQRVALARATVTSPLVLFADEPTGNLDSASGAQILGLLDELRTRTGLTLVLVTHDLALAARADRIIEMQDGRVLGGRPRAKRAAKKPAKRRR